MLLLSFSILLLLSLKQFAVLILFQEKRTPLHLSALGGHKETCALLIEAKADVNAIDNVIHYLGKKKIASNLPL